jgi:hypothetical protein
MQTNGLGWMYKSEDTRDFIYRYVLSNILVICWCQRTYINAFLLLNDIYINACIYV